MIITESANHGRKGTLGFVGALLFGAGAACLAIFLGGTLGIILAGVCGAIGLCCAVGGLVVNYKQSKTERDLANAYHATGTVKNVVDIAKTITNNKDKSVSTDKSISTEVNNNKQEEQKVTTKQTENVNNDVSNDNLTLVRRIVKKIV